MRVLIVEDEALVADYLEALVLSFGYEVCAIAASAPEAVEDAAIHKPDVALMVRLPRGTSGIDAACEIYSSQGLRCVFLSENLDDATRRTLNLCQPIVFIDKPVLPGAISAYSRPVMKLAGALSCQAQALVQSLARSSRRAVKATECLLVCWFLDADNDDSPHAQLAGVQKTPRHEVEG